MEFMMGRMSKEEKLYNDAGISQVKVIRSSMTLSDLDGSPSDQEDERLCVQDRNADHGLEAGDGGSEDPAQANGLSADYPHDGGKEVRGWRDRRGSMRLGRRMHSPHPQNLTISQATKLIQIKGS